MYSFLKRIIWIIMVVPPIYLAIVWSKLPAVVPMHYDLQGEPDRFGSKNEMIFLVALLTVLNAGIYLLLTNIYRIDPKRNAVENRDRMSRMAIAISLFMAAINIVIIYYTAHPGEKFQSHLILTGVGLLFTFLGNQMYTIKPNYFAGLRLPWTLENEENWKKTHLLAGKMWFIGGLAIAVISFLVPDKAALIVALSIIIVLVIVPSVYSYRLYKKQKALSGINNKV